MTWYHYRDDEACHILLQKEQISQEQTEATTQNVLYNQSFMQEFLDLHVIPEGNIAKTKLDTGRRSKKHNQTRQ